MGCSGRGGLRAPRGGARGGAETEYFQEMAALHVFPCIRGFDRVFAWLSRQLGASGLHCREGTTDSSRLAKRKIDFCNDFIDNSHFATCAAAEYPFGVSPMPTTLDIDTLRSLIAIVDTRSFSLAAERLGRSQSAIRLQIAPLEGAGGRGPDRARGRCDAPAGHWRADQVRRACGFP